MHTTTIIGASGGNGRLTVREALRQGLHVRATSRHTLADDHPHLSTYRLDGRDIDQVRQAIDGADSVILAHGNDSRPYEVNYVTVLNTINAAHELGQSPHLVLTSTMGATQDLNFYREVQAWKRRAERLVRASGLTYTIIRPGWFDHEGPSDARAVAEQGDHIDLMSGRGVSRQHIAEALDAAALEPTAHSRTIELFSDEGKPVTDWAGFYSACTPDPKDALEGVLDNDKQPLSAEDSRFLADLEELQGRNG